VTDPYLPEASLPLSREMVGRGGRLPDAWEHPTTNLNTGPQRSGESGARLTRKQSQMIGDSDPNGATFPGVVLGAKIPSKLAGMDLVPVATAGSNRAEHRRIRGPANRPIPS
jgi:hypothetical protein